MTFRLPASLLAVSVILGATAPAMADETVALLQGLDKTTARVTKFDAPIGKAVGFGTLTVIVRDCRTNPPEDEPESAAYLEIQEAKPGEAQPVDLFKGWMFASSPAVSALEHPIYDVWVLGCKNASGSVAPATPAAPPAAPAGAPPKKG